ncbi:MAG: hypothetical protein PF485_05660 [Bacteroidales bacterium]|jgi:hypothetical protein|nr:hypothetical protein [Bacteroidales bacterium]
MTKLLTILLILVSLNGFSQTQREIRNDNWLRLGLFTSSIVLNSIGDGFNNSGNKDMGHLCNALSIGVTLSIPLIIDVNRDNWAWYLFEYTFIRFAIFDYAYNMAAGNDLNYIGNSNYYDKALQGQQLGFAKAMSLTVGIAINFQQFNK